MGAHMRQVTNRCRVPAKVQVRWDNRNRNDLPGLAGFFIGDEVRTKTKKPPLGGYDITAYCFILFVLSTANMVPGAGLEPAQP